MKIAKNLLLLAVVLLYSILSYSQRGKDGSYTSSTANFVLNSATYLTANATINSTSITVNSNSLTGGFFAGALAQGDLILIMQMQGATMDIDPITSIPLASGGWGGHYTVAASVGPGPDWHLSADIWGQVTNYNQAGKFEQVEVLSVSGTNTINLQCPLKNNYTSAGHVQVIRVPRFQNLTINTGASLVPAAWNGNTGGVVAVEVSGNLVLNGTGKISATGLGFRGGVADNQGGASTGGVSTGAAAAGTGIGDTYLASDQGVNGARKGEGIGGYTTEYAALYSVYGRSGAANGGGGAGYQNAGGGGGSNIGTAPYTGKGNPNPTYASYWNLELAGFGASTSSGGGRGGYTLSTSDQNEAIVGPNNTLWGSGYRKPEGGYGGHTLAYDNTRIFMGGGGGAGDQDNLQGGSGGAGGGVTFLTVYGTISGTGSIESNGADGLKSNPTSATPGIGTKKGTDGAGGAGAGGSIYIQNISAIPSTITLTAKGGKGGDNAITLGTGITTCTEANGPGGGGAGGAIALTSGTPTQVVTGGANGVVTVSGVSTSSPIANFPMNGATVGGAGMSGLVTTIYDLIPHNDTICSGNTASLSVTVTGTLPTGGVVYWYSQQFGGTSIASGTTFVTPALTATTTYYAGVCPGTFRIPVIAVVRPKPTIAGTAVVTNAGCTTLGSITGLSVSGGTAPYTYSWNSITSTTINLTNAAIGTYNLLVTDSKGCTATSGPYTITGSSGPVINAAGVVVTNQSCTGINGSITGITATGNGLTYNWSNSGGVSLNASNLVAGSYTLTVTDNLGCTATSGPYTISATVGPTLNVTGVVTTATTCGQSNGSITGIVASGTGLTYNWNSGLATTLNLTNKPAGNYTLVVTDVNGCSTTSASFTINSTGTLSLNTSGVVITNDHCSLSQGSISGITISGGTNPISYSWTNSTQTTLNITNLNSGVYTLTATDGSGCVSTSSPFTLTNIAGPTINSATVVVTNGSCGQANGSITGITAVGTSLTYSWSNGGGASLNASNLAAGNYSLTVTDNLGCTASVGPYSIVSPAAPTISVAGIVIQPVTCGQTNGSITGITATGTGLTYNWNNGLATTLDILNQPAGNYTLVVKDANNCAITSSLFTINSTGTLSVNSVSVITTDEHCAQANGTISGVTISGGTNPISYSWSNTTQTTLNLTGLTAGTYTLTATDGSGCSASSSPFVINNIAGPVVNSGSVVVTNGTCGQSNGAITGITATGNSLSYSWDNGGGTLISATNLSPGSYYLTVSDNFGCTVVSGPFIITSPAGPVLGVGGVVLQAASCGVSNGSITGITATGSGLSYNWNNGLSNTLDLTNQPAGNYTLTVTDANNCNATSSVFTINSTGTLVVTTTSASVIDEHCSQSDGSITGIVTSGGTNPISYSWTNTAQTTLNLTGIPTGIYTLTATDASGCIATSSQIVLNNISGPTINEANALVLNESCALNDASISGITSTGVVAVWSNNGGTNLNATGLSPGTYILTVSDAFGCTAMSNPYQINGAVPMVLNLSNLLITDSDCDQNNGAISGIQINGGINPQVLWSNNSTSLDLSLLAPASYQLNVIDNQGCSIDTTIVISTKTPPIIDVSTMILTESHCGSSNGSVTGIKVTGGTPDYSYKWNSNSSLNTLDLVNIPNGAYDLQVTDNAGCTDNKQIVITDISGPSIDLTTINVNQISCSNLGSITNLSVIGSGPFTYQWSNNVISADNYNLTEGNYSVIVTDAFGCKVTSPTFNLSQTDKPIADFYWNPYMPNVGNEVHFNNTSTNAVSYSWSFGDGTTSNDFEPNHIYTDELIKQYTLYLVATSNSGCVDTAFYTIIMNDDLIYYVPNSFTPNNDQLNNVFQPIFTQGIDTYDFSLLIYNRWGEVIFESKDASKGWDGTYNGIVQQDGTYTWKISFKMSQTDEKKLAVGHVNLLK